MAKDKVFGKRIAWLRKNKMLEQKQAADKIGIIYETYQKYEYGNFPSRKKMDLILSFYGCNKAWLLTGEGEPYPNSETRDPQATVSKNESAEKTLKAIVGLMDENRELKNRIGKLEEKCSKFEKVIELLQKENTELRREVNRFKATYEDENPCVAVQIRKEDRPEKVEEIMKLRAT